MVRALPMPLVAHVCPGLDAARAEAAREFLTDFEGPTETVDGSITAALVAEALGLGADGASLVRQDPGAVTVLNRAGGVAMVNVLPADPLRPAADVQRRLLLVRHGEADTPSADGIVRSHAPLPLTARGREQAQALRDAFRDVDAPVVHASDIARTAETARALEGPGREVRLDPGLRELSLGDLDGAHMDEILAAAPGFLLDPDVALPGGESIRDVAERAGPALDAILAASDTRDVVVVAHGGVNRALLGHLLGIPLDRALLIRQDWACVNVLERAGDRWRVGMLNWTPEGVGEFRHARRAARLHNPEWRRSRASEEAA